MPGGDRTGPMGEGPMTGWQRGFCSNDSAPDEMNTRFGGRRGRGFGRGRGRGGGRGMAWRHGREGGGRGRRGRGNWGDPELFLGAGPGSYGPPHETELNMLKNQASQLEGALEDIKRRITELEQETAKDEQAAT